MVPMDSTAKQLGARVVHNKQLGSIDISLAQTAMAGPAGKSGKAGAPAQSGPIVLHINAKSPGSAVDIPAFLVAGRMNIVEFGASW